MSIKPTEKLWNANYNKVMLINFTLFFSFYLITPLLPLYMSETFHSTKDIIGLVLSGYSVVALLMAVFFMRPSTLLLTRARSAASSRSSSLR